MGVLPGTLSEGKAYVQRPPNHKSVLRLKNEAGKSIEYNGIYYRVIYLQEDWVGVEETTHQSAQIILCCYIVVTVNIL